MIRKFLFRCLLFSLAIVLCFCGITAILNKFRAPLFDMDGETSVFLGNSHIETSINDSIITGAVNFARSAEVPEYMYLRIKLLHQYNPQLDTIYLCFDTNQIYYEATEASLMHPSFYDQLTLGDISTITSKGSWLDLTHHISHPFSPSKLIDYYIVNRMESGNIKSANNLGGFMYLKRDKLEKAIEKDREMTHGERSDSDINPVGLYFMDRIYDYCKYEGLTLIFICPPQHPLGRYEKSHFLTVAARRYPDITMLNFLNAPMPDSCYGDLDHLNHRGARAFSRFLEDSILHRQIKPLTYTDSIK